jgi:hypothetical protein
MYLISLDCNKEEYLTFRELMWKHRKPLLEGTIVKKYQRKKGISKLFTMNPNGQARVIIFESPFLEFMWLDENTNEVKKRFLVSEIMDIIEGKKSDNFDRFPKAKKELCFSILMTSRTIDLECSTEKNYLELLSGFKFIH